MTALIDDHARLLVGGLPLLDVRAPAEFSHGAFPGAVNVPLLDDEERRRVGTAYKREGQAAAIALGQQLVRGDRRAQRLDRWLAFFRRHPEGALYCFRGGLRSEIVQSWLAEAGAEVPRVAGGYKAMRRFLIDETARLARRADLLLLGGRTGAGKTERLEAVPWSLDLEGLANHRGSGFGRRVTPQPTPVDFENALAITWLRLEARFGRRVLMEDESRCIGRCALPEPLWARFAEAPVIVVEEPKAARIARIRGEYVVQAAAEFEAAFGAEGFSRFREHLLDSLDRIRRRLGGALHAELRRTMEAALEQQYEAGVVTGHDAWIAALLERYYDAMYDYQLARKADRVVFSGEGPAVEGYLRDLDADPARALA